MDAFIKAVLIVEGADERDVVNHLLAQNKIDGLALEVLAGRGDLMNRVKKVAYDSAYRDVDCVGIIFDSEEDPAQSHATLQAASQYLLGLQRPKQTKVLQLPSEQTTGSFEALCLAAIAPDDAILRCCEQFIDCLADKPHALTTQARRDKTKLLAWYAAKTGKQISRIGIDVEKEKAFNFQHAAFDSIVQFLKNLSA